MKNTVYCYPVILNYFQDSVWIACKMKLAYVPFGGNMAVCRLVGLALGNCFLP